MSVWYNPGDTTLRFTISGVKYVVFPGECFEIGDKYDYVIKASKIKAEKYVPKPINTVIMKGITGILPIDTDTFATHVEEKDDGSIHFKSEKAFEILYEKPLEKDIEIIEEEAKTKIINGLFPKKAKGKRK
ncbi:MAG: hypothetical protein WC942_08885 [Clostridia bacterium]|jgi:hypothetical protein